MSIHVPERVLVRSRLLSQKLRAAESTVVHARKELETILKRYGLTDLSDLERLAPRPTSWRKEVDEILAPHGVQLEDLKSRYGSDAKRRLKALVCEHLRNVRGWSLQRIGELLSLNHTSVMHAIAVLSTVRLSGLLIPYLQGKRINKEYKMIDLNALSKEIFENNVAVGWWPNGVEGRNVGELLALVHSEISEAYEGQLFNLQDDKLPDRPMVEVEMADAVIRLLDIAGSRNFDFSKPVGHVDPVHASLMGIHWQVTQALEGFRKGNIAKFEEAIIKSVILVIAYSTEHKLDLWGAVSAKRQFNAQRADHKLENRAKAGGKAF